MSLLFPFLAAGTEMAAGACGIPRVESPRENLVVAERPALAWTPVEKADHYRVKVKLRVPEGPLLASLEVIVREPRFELPHPPQENRVLVTARVAAHCGDTGYGPDSEPEVGGRFLLLKPIPCRLDGLQSGDSGEGLPLSLSWQPAVQAQSYEVVRFNVQTGLLEESWKVVNTRFSPPLGIGASKLYGVRPYCAGKPGGWAYFVAR